MQIYFTFDAATVIDVAVMNTGNYYNGNGNNRYTATLVNDASINTDDFAVGTSSLRLVATDSQYVSLPPVQFGTNGLSFSCWFKSDGGGRQGVFVFGNGAFNNSIAMSVLPNGNLYLDVFLGGTGYNQEVLTQVNGNVWVHVVWTIDADCNWVAYVNGVAVYSDNRVCPSSVLRSQNFIGKGWGTSHFFNGDIDDFRMYNGHVLSTYEISTLYYG